MKIIKHDLPQFDTLEIYPLADVHIGDPLHDKKRAKQFINEVLEKENRYVIVNGDIINNAVKHGVSDVYNVGLQNRRCRFESCCLCH